MPALADLASDPAKKDVVIGALGASSALAGLILVFLGSVVSAYRSLLKGGPREAGRAYRIAVGGILGAFCLGLLGTTLALLWLMSGGGHLLYVSIVVTFFVQLVTILAVAFYTTWVLF